MTWEPSRKTLLVLRTDNKVEDRSDFLFSLIVFRRLHVFKLRFFLFSSVSGFSQLSTMTWCLAHQGVSYCYSAVSSSSLGVFFMLLFLPSNQLLLDRLKRGKLGEPRQFSLGLSLYHHPLCYLFISTVSFCPSRVIFS